jgi:hypothetical protein
VPDYQRRNSSAENAQAGWGTCSRAAVSAAAAIAAVTLVAASAARVSADRTSAAAESVRVLAKDAAAPITTQAGISRTTGVSSADLATGLAWDYDSYDYGCGCVHPYYNYDYNPYSCYLPGY